jgi:hypothetical protein
MHPRPLKPEYAFVAAFQSLLGRNKLDGGNSFQTHDARAGLQPRAGYLRVSRPATRLAGGWVAKATPQATSPRWPFRVERNRRPIVLLAL